VSNVWHKPYNFIKKNLTDVEYQQIKDVSFCLNDYKWSSENLATRGAFQPGENVLCIHAWMHAP